MNTVSVSIAERIALLRVQPCFALFPSFAIKQMAELMVEKNFSANDIIVQEDDPVESFYIVVQGTVEVARNFTIFRRHLIKKKWEMSSIAIALLYPGDAIGLNETGLFSGTGKRTATVRALTGVQVVELDLRELSTVLTAYPELENEMTKSVENTLRISLIKNSLAFSQVSPERLQWLAEQIEEITVPQGEIIFHEGEQGDRCFLIREGEVEIFTAQANNKEHLLATLTPPTLFGEATLITQSPRNASARAKTHLKLFVLKDVVLTELMESEQNVADMFMTLSIDRSRPLRNDNIMSQERMTLDKQLIYILKNPENNTYFKLSPQGWFLWQHMDGNHSMQELTLLLAEKFKLFSPDIVAALISRLAKSGFIQNEELQSESQRKKLPLWLRGFLQVRKILEYRYAFGDADAWVTALYNKWGYIFFLKPVKVLLFCIAALGCIAFGFASLHAFSLFKTIHADWLLLILLIPFSLIAILLHELAHALTTKAFGHEVHYMGIGWYWLTPVAFTDTSDMWLSTRGPRIWVNLAGIIADFQMAAGCIFLFFIIANPYTQAFLWLFALYIYISIFRMLSPLQELDGYYVLMDVFDRPKLRVMSMHWLMKHRAFKRKYFAEISYWIAVILYLFLMCILTLVLQTFVFKLLGFKPAHMGINFILPFLIVFVSSLSVIADLRKSD